MLGYGLLSCLCVLAEGCLLADFAREVGPQSSVPPRDRALGFRLQERQGNWQLALKVGKTATLGFSNALWTNSDLLNEASAVPSEEDAKYSAFNTEPFKRLRMCIGSPESNCVEHVFSKKYDSAKDLFNAGYVRDETVKRDEILATFGPKKGSYQDCPMQRPVT